MGVTRESTVLRECQLAATECGARVWRNNVGMFLSWSTVQRAISMLLAGRISEAISFLRRQRPITCGLCPGSADLIGLTADGRFLAIECKRPKGGRVSEAQCRWLHHIAFMGGKVIIATSGDDVRRALE